MRSTDCLVHSRLPGMTVFHDQLAEGVCVDTSRWTPKGRPAYWETAVVGPAGDLLVDGHEWTITFEECDAPLQHASMVAEVARRIDRARAVAA